jgi:carbon monoxide dehydrogenase subunit G
MKMASIRKVFEVAADPAVVWDAFRDVGAIHTRLARGFVTDTVPQGNSRLVTFVNGFTVRELIVTIDDANRRLVYAATGGRTTHHNASFEVASAADGGSRVVWTADLLPDDAAPMVDSMMEQGVVAMRQTLAPH